MTSWICGCCETQNAVTDDTCEVCLHSRSECVKIVPLPAKAPSGLSTPRPTYFPPKPLPPLPPSYPAKQRRWWVWGLVLLALIGCGWWYLSQNSAADREPTRTTVSQTTSRTPTARPTQRPTATPADRYLINEDFGYPHSYQSSRDTDAAVSYSGDTLKLEILQPNWAFYFPHAVSPKSEYLELTASCTHHDGLNGGCFLIWQPDNQIMGYQLEVHWTDNGMSAVVAEFYESDLIESSNLSGHFRVSSTATLAQMTITFDSGFLSFQVNDRIIYSMQVTNTPPQQVGFGAFLSADTEFGYRGADSVTVSYDYFGLVEKAD